MGLLFTICIDPIQTNIGISASYLPVQSWYFTSIPIPSFLSGYNVLKNIDGKRFLIVLDDLCYEDLEKFRSFGELLRYGAEGSRVIVTTQTEEVAQSLMVEVLGGHELDYEDEKMIYHLGCLDEKASFALLKSSIQLSQRQGVDENLNEVLNKCGGKPLAIRTIGSMLYLENLGTEWQNTFDIWEKQKKTKERENALRVIKSNYEHSPAYLKPCFVYCSLFPKNYEFDVPTLVKLWISQGFVACLSEDDCPEDVADKYVMELQERLFFEEVKRDEWGALRSCKMQSLMYDLAKEIAGVECASLRLEEEKNILEKTHHVLFDFHLDSPWQLPDALYKAKRIRTIILHSQLQWQIEGRSGTSICDTIVLNFKFLRTLDLHNSGIKVVSNNIGKLKNLKYLISP
ncbi:putative disease resistance protein RGA4 [Humulus lupulus]|uniref:putative disease resistance protein RGA4 n=1 Tax=Humulus lupulus TaxID=3486 RepID=UPI002B40DCD9|nr:putative disease resistance protein RGA4 [Humulus lupulus]